MKAYLVLDLTIHDLPRFMEYIERIPELIKKHGGRYIVQGTQPSVVEGDWHPERLVIIEFPSKGSAEYFLQDPEAKALFAIRHQTTISKLVLVEGNS